MGQVGVSEFGGFQASNGAFDRFFGISFKIFTFSSFRAHLIYFFSQKMGTDELAGGIEEQSSADGMWRINLGW